MDFKEDAKRVARQIVSAVSTNIMKLLSDPGAVNLHISLEHEIRRAMEFSFELGKRQGKEEMAKLLNEFNDESKDPPVVN